MTTDAPGQAAADDTGSVTFEPEGDQEVGTPDNSIGRLLALSDGVFAIAMTLLALDLRVPDLGEHPSNDALIHALRQNSASYFSFLISFYVVASYWTRHRRAMRSVRTLTGPIVGTTIFLLLCVAALPFPAALLGKYGSEAISLVIYGSLNAIAVLAMLRLHLLLRRTHQAVTGPAADGVNEFRQLVGTLIVFLLLIPAGYVFRGGGAWVLLLLIVVQRLPPLVRRLRNRARSVA